MGKPKIDFGSISDGQKEVLKRANEIVKKVRGLVSLERSKGLRPCRIILSPDVYFALVEAASLSHALFDQNKNMSIDQVREDLLRSEEGLNMDLGEAEEFQCSVDFQCPLGDFAAVVCKK